MAVLEVMPVRLKPQSMPQVVMVARVVAVAQAQA
jgi:hypothetical protein